MSNLEKQMEQLKKLQQKIEQEKAKANSTLGKKIITALGLEYEQLSKEKIENLVDEISKLYKHAHNQSNNPYATENATQPYDQQIANHSKTTD